jgi:hypothetical protein
MGRTKVAGPSWPWSGEVGGAAWAGLGNGQEKLILDYLAADSNEFKRKLE